jgi:hypothetical protein
VQPGSRVIFDSRSSAEALPDTEVTAWASGKRMFISSVMKDLKEERVAVAKAIRAVGAEAVWFEMFGGRDEGADAAYLSEVASSDIYLGILGALYGALLPSGRSATHDEYLEAERLGLHISVWVETGANLESRQAELLAGIRALHTTGTFNSPADLGANVRRRLADMAGEHLSPWVKLGPVVFRATRINESSGSAHIVARVRDDEVTEALRQLGGGLARLGSGNQLLTLGGRTRAVIVKDVAIATLAGMTKTVDVDMEIRGAPNTSPVPAFGVGRKTYTPMDLCALAIRRALGQTDRDIEATKMMTNIGDPLRDLLELKLPVGSMSVVAGLLLTEALVANGFAGRITRFRLGPAANNRRVVDVSWEEVKRYTNVAPERRRLQSQMAWEETT